MKLAIITADFNPKTTHRMEEIAKEHAKELKAEIVKTLHVPGVFEIPFAIRRIIKNKNIDGIITLGAVIKGKTAHDEIVAKTAAKKIMDLSIEFNKPVSLGIIGHGSTKEETLKRHEEYAIRAVEAAVKMLKNNYE